MSKKTNSYKHQEDLNIMELQKCCVCKMSKEDVKLRVTDDLRCDLCIFKTTNQLNTGPNPIEEDSEVGATGLDDSRTICLLYENLLEKIVVKNRMHRGKIKTRMRWRGNLDSLKDFLTLVLRKNGTWIEHTKRTTSYTFKTEGLTLIYYPSTTTIQLQGKLSTEIVAKIKFLKETLKNMDEQLLTTRSVKNTDSSQNTSYLSSLRSSHCPVALDIKTPDSIGENPFSGPSVSYSIPKRVSDMVNRYNSVETEIVQLRKERHRNWQRQRQFHETAQPTPTKQAQQSESELNPLLKDTLINMFNLVKGMNIRGLFTLLEQQMARTEKLHKKLDEKTREIIRLQEQLNIHVKFTSRDLPEDQEVVQLSLADLVERSSNNWNFPKKTAWHAFPPTWNPVPTFNKFDTSVDKSPPNDGQETSDEQSPLLRCKWNMLSCKDIYRFFRNKSHS